MILDNDNSNKHNDSPKEECGVIGIYAPNENVAQLAFFGLFALQHRGQEAAGIAVANGKKIVLHKNTGLVSQVFNKENISALQGDYAIGHTRYSTTGSSSKINAQPFLIDTLYGPLAVAHNGNLVNAAELRQGLLMNGVGLTSSSDTEIITMMLAGAEGSDWEERISNTMGKWEGAFSLVILTRDKVFALRDRYGFRPLSIGIFPNGGHAVASETGALRTLGCVAIREIKPGELITLSDNALIVKQALPKIDKYAHCVFEHIYFSRPDSIWDGLNVHKVRQRLGEALYQEDPVEADVVIPVPDSSIPAAIGYSRVSGIPYNDGFIKNRYIGRTFIEPTDSLRKHGIALKFNVIEENVINKRVIIVDDSIVRGNTTSALIKLLRDAGAKEIHMRITCPPIKHPCFMGVDMGTYGELIAHKKSVTEIQKFLGVDSLHFLSLGMMMKVINSESGYCDACFSGNYPIDIEQAQTKNKFESSFE